MAIQEVPSLLRLFNPQYAADPYSFYRELREKSPVYYDKMMRSWVVLGYAEISSLSKGNRLSGSRIESFYEQLPDEARAEIEPLKNAIADMMVFHEPPRHTKLRGLIRPGLTPRFIREMRPVIEELTDELLDRAAGRGRMDVIHDFSEPLTRGVIARLGGVPDHAAHLLERWQGLLFEFFAQSRKEIPRVTALREIFDEGAEERRAGTGKDFFSQIVAEQLKDGDFTDDEVFANLLMLIDAGQATTTHLIGNAVLALIRNRDQLELLRERRELGTQAAHEFLRYDSSVQFTTRVALSDIDILGHRIEQGESVTLVLGSGNRDPLKYENPNQLDITRHAADHLSFGHGIHYCLGAALAVAEIEIAVSRLLERTEGLRLLEDRPEWQENINFRFLKGLPVAFEPIH
ncbi:cytochrome P450 [Streptomyces cyanogenus]|uniref:Biotin biosynthesis cytochrome P450 n=1 Tax=Streptomyces cyanogenus TaxID=80860 RepID=A0ABX7TK04_STRCY|nr:cytochrome P450 [Streptomyces cyanogenus]QTD96747.1 Biotin biosynthesis cytochrome P450 [Streptomyces cyanogenus]